MSREKSISAINILDRAKNYLGIKTDTELASLLNLKQNTISSWRGRGYIDLISIIKLCDGVNTDWLIYGEGRQHEKPKPEFDVNNESRRLDQMILETVKDMEIEKKRYIAEYVEREKFFWEFKKKNNGIDDYGILRKAG